MIKVKWIRKAAKAWSKDKNSPYKCPAIMYMNSFSSLCYFPTKRRTLKRDHFTDRMCDMFCRHVCSKLVPKSINGKPIKSEPVITCEGLLRCPCYTMSKEEILEKATNLGLTTTPSEEN